MGSLLLFFTNYFAILLTGSFVFGLMGYPTAALHNSSPRIKRAAVAVVVVMIIVVAVPLGYQSFSTIRRSFAENKVAESTQTWLEGSDYRYVSAKADDDTVEVIITGSGEIPSEEMLVAELKGELLGLAVEIEALPSTTISFETQ